MINEEIKAKCENKIIKIGVKNGVEISRVPSKLGMNFEVSNIESKFDSKIIYVRNNPDEVGLFSLKVDTLINNFMEISFEVEMKRLLGICKKLNNELFNYTKDNFLVMTCGVLMEEKCNKQCQSCDIGLALEEERERDEEEMQEVYEDIKRSSY